MNHANKLTLSWRIALAISKPDEAFESVKAFLLEHRGVVDEVAFFETFSHHLYMPLEDFEENAAVFSGRIAVIKRDGIPSVGINVLTTIGHINEGWDVFSPLPFQTMVGHDGAVSKSCACPNTPQMRDYIAQKYALFAETRPDFIWVDDDIRLFNHGIDYGCFCPACLDIFSKTTGKRFDRESLVKQFNRPSGEAVRRAWVEQNERSLESLMAHIETVVHKINPDIQMGLMTTSETEHITTYSGQAYGLWFRALKASKARPGGGFYSDERPLDMFDKAICMARQCALLPDSVPERQYELENFPYAPLRKAVTTVINECTLALAAGCNGIAFNALGMTRSNAMMLGEREPLMRRVAEARPFWEDLVAHVGDSRLSGFCPAWHPRLLAHRVVRDGEDWLGDSPFYEIRRPNVLARLGMPLCVEHFGNGVILHGRVAEAFDDDQLRQMLAGPVLMDAFALEVLAQRGLEHLCGVRLAGWLDNGVAERMTDDPLNGSLANRLRDIRPEFWHDPLSTSACLEPQEKGVHVLADLESFLAERRDPCMTAFENDLGGRVVVMGHAPWRFIEMKREQLLNVADWAMNGGLPVRIRQDVPVIPMVRLSSDRTEGIIILLHTGLDNLTEVTVEVRGPVRSVQLAIPGQPKESLPVKLEAGHCSVMLHNVRPWQVLALCLG